MAKPIFVIRIQRKDDVDYVEEAEHINSLLNYEYHVLILYQSDLGEKIIMDCYNSEKIEPIEIEELKKIVENALTGNEAN